MPPHTVEATTRTRAPRELVWAMLGDTDELPSWGPWSASRREREGTPERDGVGAIRILTKRPLQMREEIVAFDPPSHHAYRLLKGLPVQNYESHVRLTPTDDGGTEIHWRSQFDSRVPGMRAFLRRVIADVAKALATEADRRAAA